MRRGHTLRLVSIEFLPHTCETIVCAIQEKLHKHGKVFVCSGLAGESGVYGAATSGSAADTISPRPAPAASDSYYELRAALHRIRALLSATARHEDLRELYVLDGWIPPMPAPHPLLAALVRDVTCKALQSTAIERHDVVILRGSPHLSFERILEHAADADTCTALVTLAGMFGAHRRLANPDISPFPRGAVAVLDVDEHADDNPHEVGAIVARVNTILGLLP